MLGYSQADATAIVESLAEGFKRDANKEEPRVDGIDKASGGPSRKTCLETAEKGKTTRAAFEAKLRGQLSKLNGGVAVNTKLELVKTALAKQEVMLYVGLFTGGCHCYRGEPCEGVPNDRPQGTRET